MRTRPATCGQLQPERQVENVLDVFQVQLHRLAKDLLRVRVTLVCGVAKI